MFSRQQGKMASKTFGRVKKIPQGTEILFYPSEDHPSTRNLDPPGGRIGRNFSIMLHIDCWKLIVLSC